MDVSTGSQAPSTADLMGGLSQQSRDATAKILRVLATAGPPLPTREIEKAAGYGPPGQLCYRMLCRLDRLGAVVKITRPGVPSRYWQLPGASPLPLGGRKAHAYRENPPWRTAHHLTACGLEILPDVDTVLSWAAFDQMVQAEKAAGAPFWESRVCVKCAWEPKSGRVTWADSPVLVVAKSPRRIAFAELRALAALAAAHPGEFAELLQAEQVLIALGGLEP